uniref:Sulfotransferase n=1 Tax=Salix viminalis TaxID=40686 RepID=A0A6N2K5D7_SALVM
MLRLTTEKARAFNQVVPDFGMLASIISTTTISSNGENVPRDEIQGLVAGCPSEKNWDGSPLYFYKGVWYPFFAIRGALSFQQHFIARDTDIILTSMPKSGTTWLKALAFSVVNRNIYSPTESPLLTTPSHDLVRFFEIDLYSKSQLPDLEQLPSPRIFSSHSHYETLPQSIRSSPGCKIVYICRNPLDQLVSYFHFSRKFKRENVKPLSSIDEGFDNVCRGIQSQGPFWDSVLGYWKASLERPDKVLFLKYEDLKDDITFNLKKLAEFLGLPFSEKEEKEGVIEEISRLCSFDNLRNLEVNRTGVRPLGTPNTTIYDNTGKPLQNSSHHFANPHEVGVGEINPHKALNPGLVFETTTEDYLQFLCYYGYPEKNIRSMSKTNFNCPRINIDRLISNINYPSISISNLDRHKPAQTIKRTVTNVGCPNATYISRVHAPVGLEVKVFPNKIAFVEGLTRVSFKVLFDGKEASNGYNFGSVTWFDGRHSVRLSFASYGPFWDSVLGYWKASLERPDKVGDWCNDLTPSMAERFLKIVEEKLADSGLSFKTTTFSSNGENVPTDEIQGLVAGFPSEKNWDGSPLYFYKGVWYPAFAIRGAISFRQHFIARDTDIILASMPKSGTTWLKALAFSVVNRSIYSPTESPLLTTPPHDLVRFFEVDLYAKHQLPDLEQLPSPRIFSSHSHYEAMPQSIRGSGCKIVYICRNPLDQLVSAFHFFRKFKRENVRPLSSIDDDFDNVCWIRIVLERPDKVLFLKYEDLKDDITFNLKKLAEFLGIPFTDKEEKDGVIEEISKLCSFDNLRNLEVNRTGVRPMGTPNSAFFRKAKVGDWCNDLTPSMAERFLKIVEEKLAGSGLSFKVISSFKSSYFKNSTLSGLSKLAFQYPNTLSQKGPKTLDTKTNIVEIVIN